MVSTTMTLIFGLILFTGCGNRSDDPESTSTISDLTLYDVVYENTCNYPTNASFQEYRKVQ